jgi:hypothetical protein
VMGGAHKTFKWSFLRFMGEGGVQIPLGGVGKRVSEWVRGCVMVRKWVG